MLSDKLEASFPNLRASGYRVTSPKDASYNCVAWAAGDKSVIWWPGPNRYWVRRVPYETSWEAFEAALGTIGFTRCADGAVVDSCEEVAIYAVGDVPKHVARQLPSGLWTSKLGLDEDIGHVLEGLICEDYGRPVLFLARPTSALTESK